MEPRYWNSSACDIKEFLFNYDGCVKGKELIVVEGAFNCMSMWEKGFPNTVATFGTSFAPRQIQLMFSLAPESIVICFDRDSIPSRPGQKATLALGQLTHQLVPTYIMPLPIDKDPNDLSKETLMECYKKKVSYEAIRG
jgi:DNA primase